MKLVTTDSLAVTFQTPSAGRWVLQRWLRDSSEHSSSAVSNPISGEVGAAAGAGLETESWQEEFQTPSAGRWVLQLPSHSGAQCSEAGFKPHQRGGGCCSHRLSLRHHPRSGHVSNPISGEVGAAAKAFAKIERYENRGFKPHQRGGGCCSLAHGGARQERSIRVSNPISGEVGAAAG